MEVSDADKHYSLINHGTTYGRKMFYSTGTCGLYFKHITIVNDDSSVVNKRLTDDTRVVIYYRNMFIIQAT